MCTAGSSLAAASLPLNQVRNDFFISTSQFQNAPNLLIERRPGHLNFKGKMVNAQKIHEHALKELKMSIFGNTSPCVYSTQCYFMQSNMLFVIEASGISASL
jgi:hypothetical protein